MSTLVVGDTHGRADALAALLIQERIIDPDDLRRVNRDDRVIHVGDLGHFGEDTKAPDLWCYRWADDWFDQVLWGNHDRATISPAVSFNGYGQPDLETLYLMNELRRSGKLTLAAAEYGFLITHAGLHPDFLRQLPYQAGSEASSITERLNHADETLGDASPLAEVWLQVSGARGGNKGAPGGILWRDVQEPLWPGARQVFGHSADRYGVVRAVGQSPFGPSYAIDIGAKSVPRQAGIWLPEERVVRVDEREILDLYYGRER